MGTDARPSPLFAATEDRRMLRDCVAMLTGSNLATACGAVASLIIRAAVDPALMGIWSAARVVLEYAGHGSLGINRAAARDVAVAAGRGDGQALRRIADAAMTIELSVGTLVAVGLAAAGILQARQGATEWAAAFWVAAVIAIVGRYHAFGLTMLRSTGRFPVLARARVLGAAADLALLGGGAFVLGFRGLLAGALATHLLNAWYVTRAGQLGFSPLFDGGLTRQLLASGWPIAAEALALAALRSADRLVIVNLMTSGAEQLGWYSAAMLLASWVFDQSNLIAGVLYPRLAETLGRTGDQGAVLRMGLRAAERMGLAMVPCSVLVIAAGVPALDWLLPKYRPGLAAAAGLATASALLGISMPLRYALVTVGRTLPMLGATSLAAGLCLALDLAVVGSGGGLRAIAWAGAAAAGVCLLSVTLVAGAMRRELRGAVARVLLAAALLTAALVIQDSPVTELVRWLLVLACALLATCLLLRQIGLESFRPPTGSLT